MSDSDKPKSWQECKNSIKYKWHMPIVFVEWVCWRISPFLRQMSFLEVLEYLSRLAVLIAVIFYIWGCEDRQKAKHYQAWQVINLAQGKTGSGGRKDALQDLNRDGISLAGVDISNATLKNLNLENADLTEAVLSKAILIDANFSGANLFLANLYDADLHKVNLSDANLMLANLEKAYLTFADLRNANLKHADLSDADLSYADLSGAILTQIKNWEQIIQINNAYIHGVKDPPKGFVKWAIEHSAFRNANREEWEKLKRQKREEQEKKEKLK